MMSMRSHLIMSAKLLILVVLLTTTSAFVIPTSFGKHAAAPSTSSCRMMSETGDDPFDSYEVGVTKTVATKDVVVGSGEPAKEGDMMKVIFKGSLLASGRMFDEGEFTFKHGAEGGGIAGFQDGVAGLRVGGKRLIKIPSALGYGAKGSPSGKIPPNSDLEFEVEALKISSNPVEAFMMANNFGANPKTFGLLACLLVLALSPLLPN